MKKGNDSPDLDSGSTKATDKKDKYRLGLPLRERCEWGDGKVDRLRCTLGNRTAIPSWFTTLARTVTTRYSSAIAFGWAARWWHWSHRHETHVALLGRTVTGTAHVDFGRGWPRDLLRTVLSRCHGTNGSRTLEAHHHGLWATPNRESSREVNEGDPLGDALINGIRKEERSRPWVRLRTCGSTKRGWWTTR